MPIELINCEATLLQEIAMPEMSKEGIGKTYRWSIFSSEHDRIDWAKVNQAIIARWGKKGLTQIKRFAWGEISEITDKPRKRQKAR